MIQPSNKNKVSRHIVKTTADPDNDIILETKSAIQINSFYSPKIQPDRVSLQIILDQSVLSKYLN